MRMDKFTTLFQNALADGQSLALGQENQFIEPAHVLSAMLQQPQGTIKPLLLKIGVNVNQLEQQLTDAIKRLPQVQGGTPGEIHISNELSRLLNVTDKLAKQQKDEFISSELFLLALLEGKSTVGDLLRQLGANAENIKKAILDMRGGESVKSQGAEEQRKH